MVLYIKNVVFIFLISAVLNSCLTKKAEPDYTDYKTSMMETDRNFSKLSEEKGMKHALMQYIDSNGILLRPGTIPMVGAEAIDYISQGNDTSFTMSWEPNGGSVSKSGELGYTYGVYSLKPNNKDTVFYGTYVSIWKRQPDNKWKFVLETGNEGIE
jgi:ketosteroid isomerase-like protein